MRALTLLLVAVTLVLASCGDTPPPTQIVIVISPTPEVTVSTAASSAPTASPAAATSAPTTDATTPSPNPPASAPTAIFTSQPVIQPGAFPTATVAQLAVAEQLFEGGQMFWIRYNRQIWALIENPDMPNTGDWFCYNDTFTEGEPETDPGLTPPDAALFQPRRGFGKLWRSHSDLKTHLGWATSPEYELTSAYTYIPGGYVAEGVYHPGPGEHRLTTFYNASVSFFESDLRGDCLGGTWKLTEP